MIRLLLALLVLSYSLSFGQLASAGTISICVDIDPPAPAKVKRDLNGKKIIPIEGASVEIVRAAFAHMGQPVEFIGDLPWKRCLKEVELGTVDFALGAYYDEERNKIYDYSNHYSTLTPQLFYLAENPVTINQPADLKKYRGCGIYGSSYEHYMINAKDLDLGNDYESLYRKLLAKRCDFFVEELEAVYDSNSGKDFLSNPLVKHESADWASAPARHLVTAKNSANSAMLQQINAALDYVIHSGQAEAAWRKTMGNLPFKP